MDNLEKIQKINDSIFMSNIGVLYDGIIKLDEIVCCGTKIEEAIKSAYGEENNTPMQNVLFSYIRFIKTYINDIEDAISYTKKLYYLYCSAKKLLDSSLQQIRSNLQDVAKTAGELVDSNECYIVYYDEHTQTSTEIAWDCSAGNYEDGGAYSEYIGSMLQGIHQNELKSPFDNNFFVKELNWYKNIQIIERASNIRVFSVEESNRGELGETEKTYFISIKMPIEFNKKPQNGISVYFIFKSFLGNKILSNDELLNISYSSNVLTITEAVTISQGGYYYEYSSNNGTTWTKYTQAVTIPKTGISIRVKNSDNVVVGNFEIIVDNSYNLISNNLINQIDRG